MSRRYLVTGASGFIGTHLIRRLVADKVNVVAVDILEPRERLAGVDYRTADVRSLAGFDPGSGFDRIYNLAAVHTTPGHAPYEYYQTNIAGASEITKLAERTGTRELIFTSSISVYGPSEEMKTEENPPAPQSDYGHSKLLAEQIHRGWLERDTSRKLTIVRPAVVFGPGEGGNFARLAKLLNKGVFIYPGRRDTVKACIYVQDLLDAIHFSHDRPESFVLFNGSYPERYTLQQIVDAMIENHFPGTRSYLVPRPIVTMAASVLGAIGFLNIGIHPERVNKLVRSTDIYPDWLSRHGFPFPTSLPMVLSRWKTESNGTFV